MHIVSIKFFLLDIWRDGQDIKSQVQIHCKDVVPMMGLDHHSCPLVSLMILRCVPIWKQRESGRGYSSPEESNQEREGEVAAKRWLFKREKSKGNWWRAESQLGEEGFHRVKPTARSSGLTLLIRPAPSAMRNTTLSWYFQSMSCSSPPL